MKCSTVLDVGAGIRPFRWYKPDVHICIEPFGPYADVLERAGYEVIRKTAREALSELRAEGVYLLDVIEHMEREEGFEVLELAKASAGSQVVVFTPDGFCPQEGDAWGLGGDHWQKHRSGWTHEDFPGWRIQRLNRSFFALYDK